VTNLTTSSGLSLLAVLVFLPSQGLASRSTPAQRCEAAKLRKVGTSAACLAHEYARAVNGGTPDVARCASRQDVAFRQIEDRADGACPTEGDANSIQARIDGAFARVAAALSGNPLPECGDGVKNDGEQCDATDLGNSTCKSLGFVDGTLSCTSGCAFNFGECEPFRLSRTGQTISYTAEKNDGIVGSVTVQDDGAVTAGRALSFVDNGDGTITDLNTGLMWEKKDRAGGLHFVANSYHWSGNGAQTTIWDWLDAVNSENGTGFAGYDDWRIPNVRELASLIDYGRQEQPNDPPNPAIDALFDAGCSPAVFCTVATCSCTNRNTAHWSSTSVAGAPSAAWAVHFDLGRVTQTFTAKDTELLVVRAVRGGLLP
jgi:hypothetical protein